jgi:uncharacterized repeat protein (TIGR02543 family)
MKKYMVLVLAALALLTACDNGADAPSKPEELAPVRIGLAGARSVLPAAPSLEDVDWFTLEGTASGKDPAAADYKESWLADFAYRDGAFYDYYTGEEAVVYLKPGSWRFTLYAYTPDGAVALKGTATAAITAGSSPTVNFTLFPYGGEDGEGFVLIYLALPEGSDVASVETTIDGEPLDPPLAVDADAVIYEGEQSAGQYLFSFVLKDAAGKTVAVVTDIVVVAAGLESMKQYDLTNDDLNGPPAAPSDFAVESYDEENQAFRFIWQDNSFNETGFTLSDGTATHAIAAAHQWFDLTGVDHASPVTYTLKAVNAFGESAAATITGAIEFTITFDADDGSDPAALQINAGDSLGAAMPADPVKTGSTFEGWYTDRNGEGSEFTADAIAARNITVYANWIEGVRYELTQNPSYDNYICNANDILPTGFTVDTGDWVTVSFAIKTDTNLTGFYVGIGDWNNDGAYEDGWIAPGWHNTKSVQADGLFHEYRWTLTALAAAPAGNQPLVFHFAANSVNKDKVTVYVKDVTIDKTNLSFVEALSWISANAEEGGNYTIVLKRNETIAPTTLSYSGKNVAITLNGGSTERTISLSSNGSLFTVESGVTLTLGSNVTVQGRSGNTASLARVNSGGTLVMESGARLINNSSNTYSSGGGVLVDDGAFTMSGGEISGNSSAYGGGGGVYVSSSGTFTMSDGAISGNTAASSGGGVLVYDSGTFTMSGGEISGNSSAYGGGVNVYGTFTMNGGTISGNTATPSDGSYGYGGGVYIGYSGTFTQSGGALSGNASSRYGGGVYVDDSGAFTKQSGGTIYGSDASGTLKNTAYSDSYGHAVYGYGGSVRNTTAGEGVTMNSAVSGAAGGWDTIAAISDVGMISYQWGHGRCKAMEGASLLR